MTVNSQKRKVGAALASLLMMLAVFGPISMDLYLPALPSLTRELHAPISAAQLTITACLVGLALGQIIAGPLSDRYGRRGPLLIGIAAYAAASGLCALSPSIETLIAARLVQGLAGAVGIVISQAAGRDVYDGRALVRYYGRLSVLASLAAIVGPVLGGQLTSFTDWRGLFVVLAGIGIALLLLATFLFSETLAPSDRRSGGLRQTASDFKRLLTDRVFVGAALITGFVFAAIFAYLAGATFILQGIYGLTPQGYSVAFGINSAGGMLFGYVGGQAGARWSVRGTLTIGLVMCALGAVGLLATGLANLALPVVMVSLFLLVSGMALASAPTTTLALSDYPDLAGTASSLLGLARYAFGGVTAPLVGLAGALTVLPLGIIAAASIGLALVAHFVLINRSTKQRQPHAEEATLSVSRFESQTNATHA